VRIDRESKYVSVREAAMEIGVSPAAVIHQLDYPHRFSSVAARTIPCNGVQREDYTLIRRGDILALTELVSSAPATNTNRRVGPRSRLYLLGTAGMDGIKVGHATKPKQRLREHQCGSLPMLVLLWSGLDGTGSFEASIQRDLNEHRIHGEWFPSRQVAERMLAYCGYDAAWATETWREADFNAQRFADLMGHNVSDVVAPRWSDGEEEGA
jgi:hypothetical protein